MKQTKEFKEQFLTNTSETGRHIVFSKRTGRQYFVEAIDNSGHAADWGDVDPATKKLTGKYGSKFTGSVTEKESIITKENGFDEIHYSGVGCSPYGIIQDIDSKYPDKE